MPHKHTRRDKDLSAFDLPPSQIARPLPVAPARNTAGLKKARSKSKPKAANAQGDAPRGVKRKRDAKAGGSKADDAPRAFKRLMALAAGKRVRSGLDDGQPPPSKKAKKAKAKAAAAAAGAAAAAQTDGAAATEASGRTGAAEAEKPSAAAVPTIRPGERLSDFAARVDAALPLGGLIAKSGNKDPLGVAKVYRTKQERKLHKLYAQWRLEDAKIKDRQAEAEELAEEREMELDETLGVKWRLDFQRATTAAAAAAATAAGKSKKKKAGGGGGGKGGDDDDDDMWAEFNRRKLATSGSTVRAGIHDVATAPPELTKINSSKFKFAQKAIKAKEARGNELAAAAAAAGGALALKPKPAAKRAVASDIPKSAGSLAERAQLQAVRDDVLASYRKLASSRRQAAAEAEAELATATED